MKSQYLLILIFVLLTPLLAHSADTVINRYAIVAGANQGGKERHPLKYAQSDARLMAKVFSELGGVDSNKNVILVEPTPQQLLSRIEEVNQQIIGNKKAGVRNEFLFYYSGHSDENGLLLGENTLEYKRLRTAVKDIDADVKVAILDSCASGAFTRIKGGKRRPTFLVDESSKVKGHAFLASSSAEESAQESDAIGGSYFTHYLISALRGAGDTTNDKRVTLNEAYQFAFHETLARTENSLYGAQHAAYDIQLAGAGDLVLTDLRNANATLVLPKAMSGRLYIRNAEGNLVVELNKLPTRLIQLAMEPGDYTALIDQEGTLSRAQFSLQNNGNLIFDTKMAQAISVEEAIARGEMPQKSDDDYVDVDFKIHAFPDFEYRSQEIGDAKERVKLDVNLLVGQTDSVDGVALGAFMSYIKEDMTGTQASFYINYSGGDFRGGRGTGIANIGRGNFEGGQGAGGFNINLGNVKGGMGAGGFNVIRGDMEGGAGAAGFNVVKGNLKGGVGAAGFNVVKGNVDGGVGAAGFNVVNGNVNGGVGAAGFNVVKGDVVGGVGAAGFNVVKGDVEAGIGSAGFNIVNGDVKGVMGTAGFNIATGKVQGVQASALLNVAREMKGVQVGMLNFGEHFEGVPVGMLSLYKNGRKDPGIAVDDLGYATITFKSGTQSIYNLLAVGLLDKDGDLYDVRTQWGIGKHFVINRWSFVETDFVFANSVKHVDVDIDNEWLKDKVNVEGYCVFCANSNNTFSLRVSGGTKVARFLKFYGGASINLLYDVNPDKTLDENWIKPAEFRYLGKDFKLWPGVYAGVEF